MKSLIDIKAYSPDQWVIWAGAGISKPSPTCLPLGRKLTEFALENACGSEAGEAIITVWDQVYGFLDQPDIQNNFGSIPRLESILDVINEVETKAIDIDFSFMKGFKAFLEAPFNNLHASLSILLSLGAHVITPNFDLCIEKAYNKLFSGKDMLVLNKTDGLIEYKSVTRDKTGEVWHYHGAPDEIDTMGATLHIVKDGLQQNARDKLTKMIQRAKVVIFVGYSFSDAFDINPYFDNQLPNSFSGTSAIYFQHVSGKHHPKSISPSEHISHLLQCFNSFQYDFGKTDEFLASLSGKTFSFKGSFDWEKAFLKYAHFSGKDAIQPFLICRLSNFLGIDVNKISRTAFRYALKFEGNYPNDDFHDTIAVVLRKQNKFRLEKEHHLLKQMITNGSEKRHDALGYYYGIGNYKEARKYAESIDQIFVKASNPSTVLNWRLYTSTAVYCRSIIKEYLIKIGRRKIKDQDILKIKELLSIVDLLGNRPLHNVIMINQIATALRFKLLFTALLFGKNDIYVEHRIFYLYGESSSIDGYISTFRDVVIKHIFLLRFHNQQASNKLAHQYALNSLKLAQTVGRTHEIRRARMLLVILRFSSVINFVNRILGQISKISI